MKKLLLVNLFWMPLHADASLERQLEEAIRKSQAPMVNQLLRNLDLDALPKAQKKSLITDLSELADGIAQKKESRKGFFKNGKDFAMGSTGSLLALFSLMYFGHSCYSFYQNTVAHDWPNILLYRDKDAFLLHGGVSSAFAALGTYLAYKGLTCSSQKAELLQSQAIGQALQDKKEELGV